MELLFLGTGAGVPAKERNVSSIILQMNEERNASWMFDCGEATQHQILYTNVKPRKIEKIFITHIHGDHIFGLPGFLSSRSFQGGTTSLTIYGPKGVREYVEASLKYSSTYIKYALSFVEVTDKATLFEDEHVIVTAYQLVHGVPSYGYRIQEKPKPGALKVDELRALGLRPGPVFGKLKAGKEVTLEDGRVILGKDYIEEEKEGKIITICGDTRFTETAIEAAMNADVLVHEATFSNEEAQHAHDYYHSTAEQAATVAKRAHAKRLILTHISSRYQGAMSVVLKEEAKQQFPHTEIANDFSIYFI